MKTTILILSFILLQACSTNDDGFTPTLPPITQIGANTFGCFIDGKLLTPRDGAFGDLGPSKGMRFFGSFQPRDYREIRVNDFKSGTGSITIHIESLNNTGDYIINESNCHNGIDSPITTNVFCRIFDSNENIFKTYCSFTNSGIIIITKLEDGITSGTFSVKVRNINDSSDEIEITDGRFDIKFSTLDTTTFP